MKLRLLAITIILTLLYSCTAKEEIEETSPPTEEITSLINYDRFDYVNSDLISANDFNEFNNSTNPPILIDIRKNGEFEKGHIKNAQNIWRPNIRDEKNETEGLMASKEKMETLLGKLGAVPESLIVIYDAKGNPDAARLWWILKYYGHEKVAILDGGLPYWKSRKMKTTTDNYSPIASDYKFINPTNETYYASKELLFKAINDTNYIIIDTRCMKEFCGKDKKGNAGKAGRIPNSILINYDNNINYQNNLTLRVGDELANVYKNINRNKTIITYCQSGVRSALATFVLTKLMGFNNVKNYDGSWLEWSNDATLPIKQDSIRVDKE